MYLYVYILYKNYRCRVPEILENYVNAGITPHHYPMDDFKEPKFKTCLETVQKLLECIKEERKTLIHCIAGVGRTCLVAGLLLLELDSNMQEDAVIQKLQDLRGPNAIQTVKQFNFINDFRESKNKFSMQPIIEAPLSIRSVSR
ncbi:hypothetical protein QZH41_017261 [Actinostola sp. cb2023]|nr:hypothetical protein QZH41_017261 [Actinostola sp. cb2023]